MVVSPKWFAGELMAAQEARVFWSCISVRCFLNKFDMSLEPWGVEYFDYVLLLSLKK